MEVSTFYFYLFKYTVAGKKGATIFGSNFDKCWLILKIFSLTDLMNFWKKQLLNIPQYLKCITTLSCEKFVVNTHNDPKQSEANFHARLGHSKHVAQKYSPNNVSIIFIHWRKDIYRERTKNTRIMTISINQEQKRRDKMSMHTISDWSLMTPVSE